MIDCKWRKKTGPGAGCVCVSVPGIEDLPGVFCLGGRDCRSVGSGEGLSQSIVAAVLDSQLRTSTSTCPRQPVSLKLLPREMGMGILDEKGTRRSGGVWHDRQGCTGSAPLGLLLWSSARPLLRAVWPDQIQFPDGDLLPKLPLYTTTLLVPIDPSVLGAHKWCRVRYSLRGGGPLRRGLFH